MFSVDPFGLSRSLLLSIVLTPMYFLRVTLKLDSKFTKLITHFGLVLKDVVTIRPHAVEMRRLLSGKLAFCAFAILGTAKSLKALFQHHGVLSMIAGMHLHVRRGYVTLRREIGKR